MPVTRESVPVPSSCELQGIAVPPLDAKAARDETPRDESDQRVAQLAGILEQEVIPRLSLAQTAAAQGSAETETPVPSADDVAALTGLVLAADVSAALAYIGSTMAKGVPLEAIYLDLLAPTARRLGMLWKEDLCGFVEVTLGLCGLHQVLRELSASFGGDIVPAPRSRRALLMPAPGEQHTFGLVMVVEFFRRSGWDVWCEPAGWNEDLVRVVRREWFDVAGLSLSGERHLGALTVVIRAIRRASRNRAIRVLVGGHVFMERPELVAAVGADATAVDGRCAVLQARELLAVLG